MEAISEELMRQAAATINTIAGAKIRAFDVFYYYARRNEHRMRLVSFSYGERQYVAPGGILEQFLREKGSLARLETSIRRQRALRTRHQAPADEFCFKVHNRSGALSKFRRADFATFERHLANHSFGKHYVLCGVLLGVDGVEVHVSMFVLFDRTLPARRLERVQSEVGWLLQRDFMNHIMKDYARFEQELGMVRELVSQIRHLWTEFGLQGNLAALDDALRANDLALAKRTTRRLERANLFHEVAAAMLYSLNWKKGAEVMQQRQINTYINLVQLLRNIHTGKTVIRASGVRAAKRSPFNTIHQSDLVFAFVLLANIWRNAVKRSSEITIRFVPTDNALVVAVTNNRRMNKRVCRFVNGENVRRTWKGQGTTDMRRAAEKIRGANLSASVKNGRTTVQLKLTHHETPQTRPADR